MEILEIIGVYEFKHCWGMFRRLLAELIGTFLLIAILFPAMFELKDTVGFALATGLVLASVIAYIGHISGGHINPAVTIGLLVCNFIKLIPAICYIVAQVVGALLGQLVAKCIHKRELKITDNWTGINARSAFWLEVVATFLLVSVGASVLDPKRSSRGFGSAALAIGLCVSACLCAVADYRCCMNPAAALAVSVFLNSFEHQWVVMMGPLVGGVLAGLVYRIFTITDSRTLQVTPRIQIDYNTS